MVLTIYLQQLSTVRNLLGLCYLLMEGNLLKTDWYEDCSPASKLYDPDGYDYWKILSILMRAKLKITYPNGLTDSMDIFYMFKFYLLFTIYQLEIFFLSVMMATLLNIHHC